MKTTLVLKLSQENFDVLAGSDGEGTAGAPWLSLDVAYHRAVAGEDDDTAPEVVVHVGPATIQQRQQRLAKLAVQAWPVR